MEVYTYDELLEQSKEHLRKGIELVSTGIPGLDEYYQIKTGSVTDITGYPYSGKTLLLNDFLYNTTTKKGWKHLLHLPDSGKPVEVVAYLLSKKTGKVFDKRNIERKIKEHELIHELRWLDRNFKILKKERGGERPTPIEFWNFAADLEVNTASIDSWNYMRHIGSGTDYLAEVLSERNEIAEETGLHFFTIIHPHNPKQTDYDKQGNLRPPDVNNLMGGSEWANNAKNVIVVHKEEKESENFDIYVRKVKPAKIVGKTGFITKQFNEEKFEFYDKPIYDSRENVVKPEEPAILDDEELPF